jgi:hypothetical protein
MPYDSPSLADEEARATISGTLAEIRIQILAAVSQYSPPAIVAAAAMDFKLTSHHLLGH